MKTDQQLRVNELYEKTGQYMRRVASGESFVLVARWGCPVARLIPAGDA